MAEKTRVFAVRPTAGVKRGVTLIRGRVLRDFDNGFDYLFPDATDKQIMDIIEALDWLSQHTAEEWDS